MAKYFDVSEMACHHCGELPENGIDERLQNVCDAIRESVGQPIVASCFYRCPYHNAETPGSVPNSYHVQGKAADLVCPDGVSVDELASIAETCGADGIGRYYDSGFVHVDTRGYEARWTDRD